MAPLILWGATGQAKVLAEFVPVLGFEIIALFDSNPDLAPPLPGVPLFRGWEGFQSWRGSAPAGTRFLVAIGGGHGSDRVSIFQRLVAAGLQPATVVHPTAYVARNASVGDGSQLLAGSVVGAEARIGTTCIVNTRASVDHECVLGPGVHVAPGATLCGAVIVEDEAFVGAGAVVLPRLRIGRGAVVGAGSVVTKDVPPGLVVRGNPAKAARNVQ
jgi:sugar O-acyltransferase (sialic acid O-acetyltransferase NeuD family)